MALGLKEIFQLARHLEKYGQLYYQEAAAKCDTPTVSSLCSKIASHEVGHLKKIDSMEQLLLAKDEMQKLTWEELSWMQWDLEDGVLPDLDNLQSSIENATAADILELALQMERNSVDFYSGFMSVVDENSKVLLQELVKEESQHIEWLQQEKDNL